MKIKQIAKVKNNGILDSWVISIFPQNYEKMDYVEPFGKSTVFLNKKSSEFPCVEVINNIDCGISNIFKALRDDANMFIGRLKRVKYCENTFERFLKINGGDSFDKGIGEFVLRQMSRGGLKKKFQPSIDDSWELAIEQLYLISNRIKNLYIFNKSPLSIIQAFDDINTLIYVITPPITKDSEMTAEEHAKLSDYLHQFRGKVVIGAYQNAFYRKHYIEENGWRIIKKKTNQGIQQLIINY